jgi:hypothetical protein
MRSCHFAFGQSLPLGYAGLNDREEWIHAVRRIADE